MPTIKIEVPFFQEYCGFCEFHRLPDEGRQLCEECAIFGEPLKIQNGKLLRCQKCRESECK
jgi:hypothetical protein